MSIDKKDVEHIAKLARIESTDAEKEKFGNDLSGVLDFVGKLNEVNTDAVEPLSGGTELHNVMREDIVNQQPTTNNQQRIAGLVKAAPEYEQGFVKVKKVF